MKKTKLMLFILSLLMGIFFLIPIKISAITPDLTADDWYNYITQYEDGYVIATIEFIEDWDDDELFAVIINESSQNEIVGYYLQYDAFENEHLVYFKSILGSAIGIWLYVGRSEGYTLEEIIDLIEEEDNIVLNFDGSIYWNFEDKKWQIEPYAVDELEYYKQRVIDLQNKIYDLNEEIQQLENALISEYERGYDEGYQEGILLSQSEAYEQGFIAGEKSQLAKNNEAFYNGIEKWLVPAIITVIALGGFVTIASIKRREQ